MNVGGAIFEYAGLWVCGTGSRPIRQPIPPYLTPTDHHMESIFDTINTDDTGRKDFLAALSNSISSSTTAMQFSEALEEVDDEESSAEGSQNSDTE